MKNPTNRLHAAVIAAFCAMAFLVNAPRAQAQANANPPDFMTYQGYLVDANGAPLGTNAPKNYDVIFRLWSASSGGTNLWSEQQTVTVDKGYFSVLLGEGSSTGEPRPPLHTVFTNGTASDRWIGITVKGIGAGGSDANILPRLRLLTSPYSFLAQKAITATTVDGGALTSGTILDERLSGNVAKLNAHQTFTGSNTFAGSILLNNGVTLFAKNSGGSNEMFMHPRWQDNVFYLNFGAGGFNIRNNASTSVMFMQNGGNVGIGTTAPSAKLHVNGGDLQVSGGHIFLDNAKVIYSKTAGGVVADMFTPLHSDNATYLRYGSAGFNVRNIGGTTKMFVHDNGNVGIGSTSPRARLEIAGVPDVTHLGPGNDYRIMNLAGVGVQGTGGGMPALLSILASHQVRASEFNAFSDKRIKAVVGLSDTARDLETIQKLRVTDYRLIDKVANGNGLKTGFIAQEVQQVLPDAVTTMTEFVPDIYSRASAIQFDSDNKSLSVTVTNAHQLKVGDKVRLMTSQAKLELKVVTVPSQHEFVVEGCEKDPGEVFVFGKQVNDFLSITYDQIFNTGIGAIQELNKLVRHQETLLSESSAKVDRLEKELAELKKSAGKLHARDLERDERLIALERFVRDQQQQTAAARTSFVRDGN